MFCGHHSNNQFARQLNFCSGANSNELAGQATPVHLRKSPQNPLCVFDSVFWKINRGRFHLHHPPPRNVDWQGGNMIQMSVRNEPGWCTHEGPGLSSQVESQFEFGDAPVGLNRRPRIAFDGELFVSYSFYRQVLQHVA